MGLQRVGGGSQVLAANNAHHWRERPDDPFRPHFEFVVDTRGVAFRREKEAVPALECLNVRNNAHASGP